MLVLFALMFASIVGCLIRIAYVAGGKARERRRLRQEQLLAELRLQEVTRAAMEQMVGEVRRIQQSRW